MRRRTALAALCAMAIVASGCVFQAPVMPPLGGIYTEYTAPLTAEVQGQGVVTKSGQASTGAVLGLFAWGDCGLDAAARNGGLTTIEYCDYSYLNVVLGIYQTFTVTAYGR